MDVRAGPGQRPVTPRMPAGYPGRLGEQAEALRVEIKWEGKREQATGAERGRSGREKEARSHE